tara:strand:+ start:106 stop:306 length:201 start_codon:yes stop_codon:yes gene_type:complete
MFCEVCKQALRCNYCIKYGAKNGRFVWMENHFYLLRKAKKEAEEKKLDSNMIDNTQIFIFNKLNKD